MTTEGQPSVMTPAGTQPMAIDNNSSPSAPLKRPFAKVNGIANESPAEEAGMKVGDLVTMFGSLDVHNNNRLRALAKLVPEVASERGSIRLQVLRPKSVESANTDFEDDTQWERLTLSLRPRPFSGRGLLGCHIVPFDG